jgi:hypothetical protein
VAAFANPNVSLRDPLLTNYSVDSWLFVNRRSSLASKRKTTKGERLHLFKSTAIYSSFVSHFLPFAQQFTTSKRFGHAQNWPDAAPSWAFRDLWFAALKSDTDFARAGVRAFGDPKSPAVACRSGKQRSH